MLEVYSWGTPNGHKVHIMLEECGLPYRVHAVDIGKGEQFAPDFLRISPNNKIPALDRPRGPRWPNRCSLFESGAILLYLAGKTGRFLPESTAGKYEVLQWLMFQMGSVGPMLGQAHHFRVYAPEKPAVRHRALFQRGQAAVRRDQQALGPKPLHRRAETYSIADIAVWPWLRSWKNQGVDLSDYPTPQGLVRRSRQAPGRAARREGACRTSGAQPTGRSRREKRCLAPRSTPEDSR